jgi:hydroxyacylglutathione hydrolase
VRIKAVICTHGHPDHFEGTVAFRDSSAKIGLSQQEERYIDEIGRPMYLQLGAAMPDYRVDFYLDDGELRVGRHEFQVLMTPGHTPGSICIYWPRHKVLVAGDVVFMQGVGRSDMPGGDAKELAKSVDRLSKLPVELLVPGHGPLVQGAARVQSNFDFVKKAFLDLR